MTRAEIIAELRRSAREDADPVRDMRKVAFWAGVDYFTGKIFSVLVMQPDDARTFILLVACALEDEC